MVTAIQIERPPPSLGLWPDRVRTVRRVPFREEWLTGCYEQFEAARLEGFKAEGTIPRDGEIADGTTLRTDWLPREVVERWIAHGWVRPLYSEEAFDLAPGAPDLGGNGVSLWEAWRAHLEHDPRLVALLTATGRELRPGRLAIKHYIDPPARLPEFGRQLPAPVRRVTRSRSIAELDGLAERPAPRPQPRFGGVVEFNADCLAYLVRLATRSMLQRLVDGELVAEGYPQGGVPASAPTPVPPVVWRDRDVVIDVAGGKILKRAEGRGQRWRCLYKFVVIRNAGAGAASSTIGAESRCIQWLECQIADGPPNRAKHAYLEEAIERFPGLSRRGAVRAWRTATANAPEWTKPGRRARKGGA